MVIVKGLMMFVGANDGSVAKTFNEYKSPMLS